MTRKCKCSCGTELPPASKCEDIVSKKGYASIKCSAIHAKAKREAKTAKEIKQRNKAFKESVIKKKKELKPRTVKLDNLQALINQWVVHVRDKGKPCCTCGTTSQTIKYDAGHMISRGASPELRFELTNIHKQCSQRCNVFGSGKRKEYELFIIETYGKDHLEWLNGPHELLKNQYPDNNSINSEIVKYRKILRDNGLKPRT